LFVIAEDNILNWIRIILWGGCWLPTEHHKLSYAGSIPAPATKTLKPSRVSKAFCILLCEMLNMLINHSEGITDLYYYPAESIRY
jgi:hypothetical protein